MIDVQIGASETVVAGGGGDDGHSFVHLGVPIETFLVPNAQTSWHNDRALRHEDSVYQFTASSGADRSFSFAANWTPGDKMRFSLVVHFDFCRLGKAVVNASRKDAG